jgi:ATP-dependent RNA helicase DeaD
MVIHADLPQNPETLIHRSGRTGRAGKKGRSILFCSPANKRRYEKLVHIAKVKPVITQFLSQKEIELKDNEKILNFLTAHQSKSPNELKFAKDLLKKFSPVDIALAYIENVKGKLSPIEEVESLDKEMIDGIKTNENKKRRKGKPKNRRTSRRRNNF